MDRAGSAHNILLNHQAAHVIGPEQERELADVAALRHPARLDVGEVVEVEPGHRLGLEILKRTGRQDVVHRGVVGLERPADEGGEAAGLVLELPQPVEVLDPLGERLNVAVHHRGGAPAAELMPLTVNFEPVVSHHLAPGDRPPHPIDEDLATTPRQRAQAGPGEPLEHLGQGSLRNLGEVVDLRRREAVDVDLGKVPLDVLEQFLVPLEGKRRMQPALHQDLVAAKGQRLPAFVEQDLTVEHVALGVLRGPIEGAEVTDGRADVRVIDVAVDVVGAKRLGMEPAGHGVGSATNRGQVEGLEQANGVGKGEPTTSDHVIEDVT